MNALLTSWEITWQIIIPGILIILFMFVASVVLLSLAFLFVSWVLSIRRDCQWKKLLKVTEVKTSE